MASQITNLASVIHILWKLLKYYNVDPMGVFREVQLDPELMKKPGVRLKLEVIERAWELADARIKYPCFGLSASEVWHPSDLGVLGYAILASDTLKTAFYRMERYHKVIAGWKFFSVSETGDEFIITLSTGPAVPKVFARVDSVMSVLIGICRKNLGRNVSPTLVTFRHNKPFCHKKYGDMFSCPVRFGSQNDSMILPLELVNESLPGANQELLMFSEDMMSSYLAEIEDGKTIPRVKKIIMNQLPSGKVTDETVAYELFTSSRNLHRKLKAEGTSFRLILDEVRYNMAQKYLLKRDVEISEIAFLLGFSDQSSFSRAFKRISGMSPREFIKKHGTIQ